MWGGIKRRRSFITELFANWNSSIPLEKIRKRLSTEPRPWFIGYSLHRNLYSLNDINCAKLLTWCVDIVELKETVAEKYEAYRYAQEMFNMFVSQHRVGKFSYNEYMRLCASGKDLTSAFKWHEYWTESSLPIPSEFVQYTWLLRIAELSPSDESAEDMVIYVKEKFTAQFCSGNTVNESCYSDHTENYENEFYNERIMQHRKGKDIIKFTLPTPETSEEREELENMYKCFVRLATRVHDNELLRFIYSLPTSDKCSRKLLSINNVEAVNSHNEVNDPLSGNHTSIDSNSNFENYVGNLNCKNSDNVLESHEEKFHEKSCCEASGSETTSSLPVKINTPILPWPNISKLHIFKQLEQNLPIDEVTFATPRLRDSLLELTFITKLERAAFSYNVPEVILLLQEYEENIKNEAEKRGIVIDNFTSTTSSEQSSTSLCASGQHTTESNVDAKKEHYAQEHRSKGTNNKRNNNNNNETHYNGKADSNECSMNNNNNNNNNINNNINCTNAFIWGCARDISVFYFREALVKNGGLTTEMYHYLIVALCNAQPTAALRTVQRMREAKIRLLDITRAVLLIALNESHQIQLELFKEQMEAIDYRRKLDSDRDVNQVVSAYWTYNYSLFLWHRNKLDESAFYYFIMHEIGVAKVQELLITSERHGKLIEKENLIVINDALREACARYLRECIGFTCVNESMNIIANELPKLDISLIGNITHFSNYSLPLSDKICTDISSLSSKLNMYDDVFILDASFVETSEQFMSIGLKEMSSESVNVEDTHIETSYEHTDLHVNNKDVNVKVLDDCEGKSEVSHVHRSLVLIPYVTLSQLGSSEKSRNKFVTFDSALQEVVQTEPTLASQRLHALFAMVSHSSWNVSSNHDKELIRHVRLLHFSESLLSHSLLMPRVDKHSCDQNKTYDNIHNEKSDESDNCLRCNLYPEADDNDHFILVVSMIRNLTPTQTRVIVCTDDEHVQEMIKVYLPHLCHDSVNVLFNVAPEQVNRSLNMIDDNPVINFDVSDARKQLSSPNFILTNHKCESSICTERLNQNSDTCIDETMEIEESASTFSCAMSSPWLSLLQKDSEKIEEDKLKSSVDQKTNKEMTITHCGNIDIITNNQIEENVSDKKGTVIVGEKFADSIDNLMNLYENPHDVIPVGAKMRAASLSSSTSSHSVFTLFDVDDPDKLETGSLTDEDYYKKEEQSQKECEQMQENSNSSNKGNANLFTMSHNNKRNVSEFHAIKKRHGRPFNHLEREMRENSGWSQRYSGRVARSLSSAVGRRIPFNFRYRLLEANVNDPRNAKLKKFYEEGLTRKRLAYLKKICERSQ